MSPTIPIENHLHIIGNRLKISNEDCAEIADKYGTPVYVYNIERVVANYRRLKDSLTRHADREVIVY